MYEYDSKIISIDSQFAENAKARMFKRLIIHEIAHAYVEWQDAETAQQNPHGELWQTSAKRLGWRQPCETLKHWRKSEDICSQH